MTPLYIFLSAVILVSFGEDADISNEGANKMPAIPESEIVGKAPKDHEIEHMSKLIVDIITGYRKDQTDMNEKEIWETKGTHTHTLSIMISFLDQPCEEIFIFLSFNPEDHPSLVPQLSFVDFSQTSGNQCIA